MGHPKAFNRLLILHLNPALTSRLWPCFSSKRDREVTENFALLIMKIRWTVNFGQQDNCSMLFWKPLKTQGRRPKDPVTNYSSSVQATLPHTIKGIINSSVVNTFLKMVRSPTEYKVTFYDQTVSQRKPWDQECRAPHYSFFLKGGFNYNLRDLLSRNFCLLVSVFLTANQYNSACVCA